MNTDQKAAPSPATPRPQSRDELLTRAQALAGLSLEAIAKQHNRRLPASLLRAKGLVGELLELHLGASAGCNALPDFPHLGVELKTIPIGSDMWPTESTFVTVVPMVDNIDLTWARSTVRSKLDTVLWIPVQACNDIPVPERRIGNPLLWSPSPEENQVLQTDFDELMDLVCLGEINAVSAHQGTWLQIRPKAANARAQTVGINRHGMKVKTLPMGFYLRRTFTKRLISSNYAL